MAMLKDQDARIAQRFKEHLRTVTPVLQMIVFGSRARGDASPESDLDIFIEVPVLMAGMRTRISEVAWEISLEYEVVISTLVATPEDIQNGLFSATPVYHAIQAEGIVV